ncbi:Polypeptide-transport-associated domain protein ShlB-type [Rippkaea orientalis PCC 8801]|uniref:Polypeptide-transport-associated domain protein ShlB-type n=1 Tax=Rippkaea orientalis (strain PCC 8801 / RF-1) TaxID=41431 RepID=B7K0C7_RIPO1|nr:Polypeptide-transport-associated domain protein ShlB-type [Rippkaea orientalis PCC 8801]
MFLSVIVWLSSGRYGETTEVIGTRSGFDNEVRSQKSEVRSSFCNEDLNTAPKTFCFQRQGFRHNFFDNLVHKKIINLEKLASTGVSSLGEQPFAPTVIARDPLSPSPPPPLPLSPPESPPPLSVPSPSLPNEDNLINIPGTITVKKFDFAGNTVFSQEELAEVTAPFVDRPLTFAELLQARSAVTKYYVNNGYVTSGSYIPPQTIENGVVTIQIVEGSLEDINVNVEGKLNPNYIRDRLALAGETPLHLPTLLESLQLLQLSPLIDSISAELSASPRPGSNLLTVKVVTAQSFYPKLILDNGRNPQAGEIRRGFELSELNLTGIGDKIRTTYYNSDGSDDFEVTYQVPFTIYDSTVEFGFRHLSGEILEKPLDVLELNSDYQKYSLRFRQPIIKTPNQEFSIGLDLDHQKSKTVYLDGLAFPGRGSDTDGRTHISTLRFSQEWVGRTEEQVLALRSQFDWGLEALGTTTPYDINVNPATPEATYFLWRGQGQWVQVLAPDTLFVIRTDIQIADRPIVSLEQFSLGGLENVEGYRQNSLLTDNGVFAAMELRFPIFRLPRENLVLQLIPFATYGQGWNSGLSPDPPINELASIGLGFQIQYNNIFSARIDWAHPLGKDIFLEGSSLQDQGINFTINISPW